jgi:ABC-type phosphate/phosphonate transport system substrate-binding protein
LDSTLFIGAVAYDPKVVTIWEGMRNYFRDEAKLDAEILLFLSYGAQVEALLGGKIDIAWNTNLAYLQSVRWSEGQCEPLAMRDTDLGWTTKIFALKGGPLSSIADLRGKTLALGSRDSGHAAILPVHFLETDGLFERRDYEALRFDLDVGKHGDTGRSELDVLKAVLSGEADAGAVGSPFWSGIRENRLAPEGSLVELWSSPPYHHCMFTARPGLSTEGKQSFVRALQAMSWDNPSHRRVLEAEGLKQWLPARAEGYEALGTAAQNQGHFNRCR